MPQGKTNLLTGVPPIGLSRNSERLASSTVCYLGYLKLHTRQTSFKQRLVEIPTVLLFANMPFSAGIVHNITPVFVPFASFLKEGLAG